MANATNLIYEFKRLCSAWWICITHAFLTVRNSTAKLRAKDIRHCDGRRIYTIIKCDYSPLARLFYCYVNPTYTHIPTGKEDVGKSMFQTIFLSVDFNFQRFLNG